jgi:hypothetical protein
MRAILAALRGAGTDEEPQYDYVFTNDHTEVQDEALHDPAADVQILALSPSWRTW